MKATGNSIPLWVEEVFLPVALGIGHWQHLSHALSPIPHAQKLHPLVGGVFYSCTQTDTEPPKQWNSAQPESLVYTGSLICSVKSMNLVLGLPTSIHL